MLKVSGLKKSFGEVDVLKGVDLSIDEGEVVVIVGPSGGGKTTLLRCLNRLERCDKGSIVINGESLCDKGEYVESEKEKKIMKDVGLVFQNFNLFPHMNVIQNLIEAPIRVLGKEKNTAIEDSKKILGFLGLDDKVNSYPYELSGGQKQRVAIGRALALEPKLICFDEPTSALDPGLTEEVAKLIKSLKDKGMTMLIITHDMAFAEMVADRILSMDNGNLIEDHIYK